MRRSKKTKDVSVCSVCVSVCIECLCRSLANLNRIRGSTDGLFTVNYTALESTVPPTRIPHLHGSPKVVCIHSTHLNTHSYMRVHTENR